VEVGNASQAFTDVTKKMIVPIRVMRKIALVPKQIMDLNAPTENASFSDTSAMEKKIAVMEVMSMLAAKCVKTYKTVKLISTKFQYFSNRFETMKIIRSFCLFSRKFLAYQIFISAYKSFFSKYVQSML